METLDAASRAGLFENGLVAGGIAARWLTPRFWRSNAIQ